MNKKTITTALAACSFIAFISMPLTVSGGVHCMAEKGECTAEHDVDSHIQSHVTATAKKHDSSEHSDKSKPLIASIDSKPAGQSYARWAAEWWQWVLGIPAATNPFADKTGENCTQRQVGDVWFLAGSMASDTVTRNCNIPAGKSLFFPLTNQFSGAFLNDPPDKRTDAYNRAAASCNVPAQITVRIDDFNVPNPTQYFTGESGSQSPIFNVQFPPTTCLNFTTTIQTTQPMV
jgi:hypothetical protein